MKIEQAGEEKFPEILEIYSSARDFMRECGNGEQWKSAYPPRELVESDIKKGNLYTVTDCGEILCVFYEDFGEDADYRSIYEGEWRTKAPYGIIHRIAVSNRARGRGVSAIVFSHVLEKYGSVRIDTHRNNIPMQRALAKFGFERAGIIYIRGGEERVAYEISKSKSSL